MSAATWGRCGTPWGTMSRRSAAMPYSLAIVAAAECDITIVAAARSTNSIRIDFWAGLGVAGTSWSVKTIGTFRTLAKSRM